MFPSISCLEDKFRPLAGPSGSTLPAPVSPGGWPWRLLLATLEVGEGAGLTVSNHLTYLDVLAYGAVRPFLFVAKSEVRRWPLLGTLASLGGTIYVDRDRGLQVADATLEIEQALRDGISVLLFPEGTSSNGSSVLPFRSPLLTPRSAPAHRSRQRRFVITRPTLPRIRSLTGETWGFCPIRFAPCASGD